MIPKDKENQIIRLYHVERWRMTTIARELGVHTNTVRNVLQAKGVDLPDLL
jgi:DNA-directed RNA polymerase specialized sigma24 family protein